MPTYCIIQVQTPWYVCYNCHQTYPTNNQPCEGCTKYYLYCIDGLENHNLCGLCWKYRQRLGQCRICKQEFKSQNLLHKHIRNQHQING